MVATNALINTNESAGNAVNGTGGVASAGSNALAPQTNDLSMLNPAMAVTGGLPTGSNNPAVATSGAFSDYVAPTNAQKLNSDITSQTYQGIMPTPAPAPAAPAPPAAAGASQAQDGNWYVPNPSGAGWMLMSQYNPQDPAEIKARLIESADSQPQSETPFLAPNGSYLNAQNQLMISNGSGGFYQDNSPALVPRQLPQGPQGHN